MEGALYAKDANGDVRMVVTVSVEHQKGFEELYEQVKEKYEKIMTAKKEELLHHCYQYQSIRLNQL